MYYAYGEVMQRSSPPILGNTYLRPAGSYFARIPSKPGNSGGIVTSGSSLVGVVSYGNDEFVGFIGAKYIADLVSRMYEALSSEMEFGTAAPSL